MMHLKKLPNKREISVKFHKKFVWIVGNFFFKIQTSSSFNTCPRPTCIWILLFQAKDLRSNYCSKVQNIFSFHSFPWTINCARCFSYSPWSSKDRKNFYYSIQVLHSIQVTTLRTFYFWNLNWTFLKKCWLCVDFPSYKMLADLWLFFVSVNALKHVELIKNKNIQN